MSRNEIQNRGINKVLFNAICSSCAGSPVWQEMGFELVYLEEGKAAIRMMAQTKFSTLQRRLHGGMLATLADQVMTTAYSTLGGSCKTVDFSINYFAPVAEETEVVAEGCVINHGRTLIIMEASIFNQQGKLISRSRGTFIRDTKYQPFENLL
ncbi:MAG TPA: PaaI family thioesterase [Syntrophomonadaceae bacterium]|nr:PaaI family thioesterase [Syntrophomonadaceae bacterium]